MIKLKSYFIKGEWKRWMKSHLCSGWIEKDVNLMIEAETSKSAYEKYMTECEHLKEDWTFETFIDIKIIE